MTPLLGAGDKLPTSTGVLLPAAVRQQPLRSDWSTEQDVVGSVQNSLVSWDNLQLDLTWLSETSWEQPPMQAGSSPNEAVEDTLLAWSAEGPALPTELSRQHKMPHEAQRHALSTQPPLQEVPTLSLPCTSSIEMACLVPSGVDGGQKRRRRASGPSVEGQRRDQVGGRQAEAWNKRSPKPVAPVRQGRGGVSAAMVGQSKASQQLKALEQINLVFQKDKVVDDEDTLVPELPFLRPKKRKAQVLAPGPRTQQLALEKNVEKLIDEVYTLGVKGVWLSERQAATKRTVQAIQDACALCSKPGSQAHFLPHAEAGRVAAECKLDAQGLVESALRCKCNKHVRVSHGALKGVTAADDLLQAPESAYLETETAYLSALANALTPDRNDSGEDQPDRTATQLAVELSLLFVLRTHLRRSSAIAAQHEGLTRLQTQNCMQSCVSDQVLDEMAVTEAQSQELVAARENYMTRTRRILQQRQALWQMVRANLLDTSLQDGCPSAESKICAFEKVLELQRNMDDYHWNFAWLMREWCLRILSPSQVAIVLASFEAPVSHTCQVMACAGLYLLETLALRADRDPAMEMLAALEIPAPQDFSGFPTSKAG
ncbi:hypothetical protein WJX84_012333 [Apatococcus fuscideae]|uniref:Uncharacterized protein n=1 Tax=Apatococcus fuscideae TaxID=2026836 RepID=A0AAW1SN73_9CHLO